MYLNAQCALQKVIAARNDAVVAIISATAMSVAVDKVDAMEDVVM